MSESAAQVGKTSTSEQATACLYDLMAGCLALFWLLIGIGSIMTTNSELMHRMKLDIRRLVFKPESLAGYLRCGSLHHLCTFDPGMWRT